MSKSRAGSCCRSSRSRRGCCHRCSARSSCQSCSSRVDTLPLSGGGVPVAGPVLRWHSAAPRRRSTGSYASLAGWASSSSRRLTRAPRLRSPQSSRKPSSHTRVDWRSQPPHLPQRVSGWDSIFCGDVREQGPGSFLLAAHPFSAIAPFSRRRLTFSAAS